MPNRWIAITIGATVALGMAQPLIGWLALLIPMSVVALALGVWVAHADRGPVYIACALLLVRPLFDPLSTVSFISVGASGQLSKDSLNPAGMLSLAVILITPMVLLRRRHGRRDWPMSLVLFAGVTFWAAATLFETADLGVGLAQFIRLLSILSFATIVAVAASESDDVTLALWWCVLASAVVPCLVALYQVLSGNANVVASTDVPRAYGTFVQPNPFAHYLALVLVAAMGLVSASRRHWRIVAMLGASLAGIALALTLSRGGWVAAACALVVTAVSLGKQRRVAVVALLVPIVALLFVGPLVAARWDSLSSLDPASNTALGRSLIWRDRLDFVAFNGLWFSGAGIGATNIVAEHAGFGLVGTHNDYLRLILELGAVGLVGWLAILAVTYASLIAARSGSGANRLAVAVGLGGASAYLVGATVENLLTTTVYQWVWWALILPPLIGAARRFRQQSPAHLGQAAGSTVQGLESL